jgi:NAD(P)-dependent dehydrogenase (short-subunit alcohol dehydrogenase family)
MLLADKVVVVTGVGPGLGREIAMACSREGAAVMLAARTEAFLKEVADDIDSRGGRAEYSPTNIVDREQCQRTIDRTVEVFGRVDALVNSAFRPDVFQPFETVDLGLWRKIFEVNVFGSLQMTQVTVPVMKAQGSGSVVFIGSMAMRKTSMHDGGYASSKAALMTASRVLAKELGQFGIRVNTVVPGWMDGPSVRGLFEMVEAGGGKSAQEQYDEIASRIPLGFIPPDEDVANAAVFFASDLSRVITGQALDVNGGETFH